jgi:hypothetical protein
MTRPHAHKPLCVCGSVWITASRWAFVGNSVPGALSNANPNAKMENLALRVGEPGRGKTNKCPAHASPLGTPNIRVTDGQTLRPRSSLLGSARLGTSFT